jgi:hypothetical protein
MDRMKFMNGAKEGWETNILGNIHIYFITKLAAVTSENKLKRDWPTVSYLKHYNAH